MNDETLTLNEGFIYTILNEEAWAPSITSNHQKTHQQKDKSPSKAASRLLRATTRRIVYDPSQ